MTDSITPSYIAIDGDNVGRELEYLVVTNQLQKLTSFSKNYHRLMTWLEEALRSDLNAKIIFSGGDSLLVSQQQLPSLGKLELLKDEFAKRAGTTLSIGIGSTPRQAYFALKLAKAKGKNRIELFEESNNE